MIKITVTQERPTSISVKEMMNKLSICLLDWCVYKENASGFSCSMSGPTSFICVFSGVGIKSDDPRSKHFFSRSINNILRSLPEGNLFYVCQHESNAVGTIYSCSNYITSTTNSLLLQEHGVADEDIPEKYSCSLTAQVMDVPVYDPNVPHIKFDKKMITNWLMGDPELLNPFTKTELNIKDLREDVDLRDEIISFMRKKCAVISRKKISSVSLFKLPIPDEVRIVKEEVVNNMLSETVIMKILKIPSSIAKELRNLQRCVGTDVIKLHKIDDKVLIISINWLKQLLVVNPKGFEEFRALLPFNESILEDKPCSYYSK